MRDDMAGRRTGKLPDTAFWQYFNGSFSGVLNWEDVDSLWASLTASAKDWYVFDVEKECPEEPLTEKAFLSFLKEALGVVHKRRSRPYCGSIYVDRYEGPEFIKIFDPTKMGTSCSCSGGLVLPRWIVSKMKPDDLSATEAIEKKRGFFGRLVGG
jgi:hypothetical protein